MRLGKIEEDLSLLDQEEEEEEEEEAVSLW